MESEPNTGLGEGGKQFGQSDECEIDKGGG